MNMTASIPVQHASKPAQKLTVLVVDDSAAQRKLISTQLRDAAVDIFTASSGAQALEIVEENDIDMVLSDWMMPGMSGLEFCRAFRALKHNRYAYFILLTSKSETTDIAQGLDAGADEFLTKPVNIIELQARIQAGKRLLDMERRLSAEMAQKTKALDALELAYTAIQSDLTQAAKLQRAMLPAPKTHLKHATISNIFKSSHHVGGDLLGYFMISPERVGVYSIDVSGHGVPSALLTVRLATFFNATNKHQNIAFETLPNGKQIMRKPSEIATVLNAKMLREIDTDLYFTMALIDVNLKSRECVMVQAGHPHPMAFDTNGKLRQLGDGGPPIGMIDDLPFEDVHFTLQEDERLLIYSDGLSECEDPSGEMLDDSGLARFVAKHAGASGNEFLQSLLDAHAQYTNHAPLQDDISAIHLELHS